MRAIDLNAQAARYITEPKFKVKQEDFLTNEEENQIMKNKMQKYKIQRENQ